MKGIYFSIDAKDTRTHTYKIKMQFISTEETETLVLPSWTPGSYMIRDYSRHIHSLSSSEHCEQIDLSEWRIHTKVGTKIEVEYSVYAFEDLSVRTSYLDEDFGLLHPTSVFLFPRGKEKEEIFIEFSLIDGFSNVYSQLLPSASVRGSNITFQAENYDLLYDSPFFLTNANSDKFSVGETKHEILIQGEIDPKRKKELLDDLKTIVETETKVMGENPNDYYLFILILTEGGYGGLEHLSSSVNVFDNNKIDDEKDFKRLLELLAHEYFHLWNVKRIRPIALGPFQYERPNLTKELWIAEGITSFYDAYFLLISKILSAEEYGEKISEDFHLLDDHKGELVMSLEESSLTAWNKLYKRNSHSHNTSISYYTKGGLLTLCMNLRILKDSAGKKDFSLILRELYRKFYKDKDRGFTKEEFFETAKEVTGLDLYLEFSPYLEYPRRVPLCDYLDMIGWEYFQEEVEAEPGFTLKEKNNSLIIQKINENFVDPSANLYLGDEILGCDNIRIMSISRWKIFLTSKSPGDRIQILFARKGKIRKTELVLGEKFKKRGFKRKEIPSPEEEHLYQIFLQSLCS